MPSGPKSQINIYLDKPYYLAGDVVDGIIILDVTNPIAIQDMIIAINGKESSYIHNGKNHHTSSAKVLEHYIMILDGWMEFPIGRYCFPFYFELPKDIPGSFEETSIVKSNFIKYHLKISPKVLSKNASLRCSKKMIIVEDLYMPISSISTHSDSSIPKFCCCGSSGSVSVIIDLDKNAYSSGEKINAHILIDNSNNIKKIKRIKLKFSRCQLIMVEDISRVVKITYWKTKINLVKPGERFEENYSFDIPEGLIPSSRGTLQDISYSFELPKTWFWSKNIQVPVQIYSPSIAPSANMLTELYNINSINQETELSMKKLDPIMFQKTTTQNIIAYPK